MSTVAARERAELCDLLEEAGPGAPTLCEGWLTADLAAHLFVRERRPLAAPGILLGGPLGSVTTRSMAHALDRLGYQGVLGRVRKGPPMVLRPIDELVNSLEYFIHTEDVRRAGGSWATAEDPELDEAIWVALRRSARLVTRRLRGAGLELVAPGRERITARSRRPSAELSGLPGELALYLYGRRGVAAVQLDGPPDAVAAVERTSFSA